MRDVTNASLVVSHQIGRERASQLDLEESLEASRYASFPYTYSTHPRELPPLAQVVGSWKYYVVAQNAAEAFEDQRLVRMGENVEEAEPEFSAAHEGLCLCSSRLLLPLRELPVVVEFNHV